MLFEKILANQIYEYLNRFDLITQYHFGFRSKISTSDALVYRTEFSCIEIDKSKYAALALLDLWKVFQSIQYILENKLFDLGFDGPSRKILIDFTFNRIQKVYVNNTSETIELYQGVPQGTVLGPLLLNSYGNNMR